MCQRAKGGLSKNIQGYRDGGQEGREERLEERKAGKNGGRQREK